MIKKIDHIAIAVENVDKTRKVLEQVCGASFVKMETNEKGQYRVYIFKMGEDLITLLESINPDGFVAKHIKKYGEGVQHIGLEVDSLEEAIKRFEANGVRYANYMEVGKARKEVLIGARSGIGVVLQIMEWMGEFKEYSPEDRMLKLFDDLES